jgi:hypothetical protein
MKTELLWVKLGVKLDFWGGEKEMQGVRREILLFFLAYFFGTRLIVC